jgi:hypothetical protein
MDVASSEFLMDDGRYDLVSTKQYLLTNITLYYSVYYLLYALLLAERFTKLL